ncbi:paralemmin-3 isoform X2 [Toxotes jaculatrix]|uniref:paralemmin-3 isoform X2 n=1 Tax=Toxotes jaculatrix TaxID=941984 RepID=UPI001B3ADB2E|nr:paralemmin-3 isoform X2 [Toxotes jaculatrix]
MDEAEKYKQRLEAIAEKRRQQDEEDRVRRELEDEKLRLQQLKRKSLRDQWLMEGAPLSPAPLDAQSPRSPLWGSQAQEIEKHIDKLQSESQRLAEEKEQMEDGQAEAVKVAEFGAEMVQDVVVQNGENNATASETSEDEVKTNKSPLLDETAVVLTNGGGDLEAVTGHEASDQSVQSNTNGPIGATEGVVSMNLKPGLSELGVSEAEPGHVTDVNINEGEEEEGTLVIRAECVIITDEGDDVPENLTPQEDQQETIQSKETLPNQDAGKEEGEAAEGVIEAEAAPETTEATFAQPAKSDATEATAEAQTATGNEDVKDDRQTNENRDGETKAEGQDKQDPASVQLQSPAAAVEGITVASVPVYSGAEPSSLTLKAEDEAATSPEGAEAASKAEDPATTPDQFQEVSLSDPQENQRTEAAPGEQEPLLSQAKVPNTQVEPAAANSPTNTETHSPTRASQGEETEAPKRKTCQCCSVM